MEVKTNSQAMQTLVLQRLNESGRAVAIATAMGTSDATISRLKNDHLENFCDLLAHAGLKIVPSEVQCFAPEKINALLTFAKAHLAGIDSSEQLTWNDGGGRR